MFVSNARSLPKKGITLTVSLGITRHWTRLKKSARDKHSSLFDLFVNYGEESFVALVQDVSELFSTTNNKL